VETQLQLLDPHEEGALGALKDIQVGTLLFVLSIYRSVMFERYIDWSSLCKDRKAWTEDNRRVVDMRI
jgi:hypothetical protein